MFKCFSKKKKKHVKESVKHETLNIKTLKPEAISNRRQVSEMLMHALALQE